MHRSSKCLFIWCVCVWVRVISMKRFHDTNEQVIFVFFPLLLSESIDICLDFLPNNLLFASTIYSLFATLLVFFRLVLCLVFVIFLRWYFHVSRFHAFFMYYFFALTFLSVQFAWYSEFFFLHSPLALVICMPFFVFIYRDAWLNLVHISEATHKRIFHSHTH